MNKEHELVLELSKFVHPDKDRIKRLLDEKPDMAYVLGLLLFNRMGGAAYETLHKTELLSATNREFRNTLEAIYVSNSERTRAYRNALADLSIVLSDVPVRYAALKGALLCELYPLGLRTSNDVDLLIERESVGAVSERLLQRGFKQGHIKNGEFKPATRAEIITSKMNRGETVPYILQLDDPHMKFLEVDLNFSLDFQSKDEAGAVRSMLQSAEPGIITSEKPLYTLCPVDFIAHLCAHLYKEATTYPWVEMNRDLSLYKFSDLYLLYENGAFASEDNTDKLIQRIKSMGLEKECYYSLYNLCVLYDIHSAAIDTVLSELELSDTTFMKRIYRPENKMYYSYDMDYVSWFFCPNRIKYLTEVNDK